MPVHVEAAVSEEGSRERPVVEFMVVACAQGSGSVADRRALSGVGRGEARNSGDGSEAVAVALVIVEG